MRNLIVSYIWIFTIVITNLTQLPIVIDSDGSLKKVMTFTMMFSWIVLLLLSVYMNKSKKYILSLKNLVNLYLFLIFILINSIININYLNSDLIRPVFLNIFIMITSFFASLHIEKEDFYKLANAYIYSSVIVAINIYFKYFRGINWANSVTYIYHSKNSLASILAISIILVLETWKKRNKYLSISMAWIFASMLIMVKSRASIIMLIIGIFVKFIISDKNLHKKITYIFIAIFLICLLLSNHSFYNFFINKIMLNNLGNNNINNISSGRIDQYRIFFENFKGDVFWIGNGGQYLEIFYLAALMSYGLIGGCLIILLAFLPIRIAIKNSNTKKNLNINRLIIVLNSMFLVNAIFEELAPFGPGVECYFLWVITGLYLGLNIRKNEDMIANK